MRVREIHKITKRVFVFARSVGEFSVGEVKGLAPIRIAWSERILKLYKLYHFSLERQRLAILGACRCEIFVNAGERGLRIWKFPLNPFRLCFPWLQAIKTIGIP